MTDSAKNPDKDKDETKSDKSGTASGAAPIIKPDASGVQGYQFYVDQSAAAGGYNFGLAGSPSPSPAPAPAPLPASGEINTSYVPTASYGAHVPSYPGSTHSYEPTNSYADPSNSYAQQVNSYTASESYPAPQQAPQAAQPAVPDSWAQTNFVNDSRLRSFKTPGASVQSLTSLMLKSDKRYQNLNLTSEMAEPVMRIFGLVDLDFNGFVELKEMHKVLESEDLSPSEKGIVKLVLSEARKILAERQLPEENTNLALTREDFGLAFAREFGTLYKSMGVTPPPVSEPELKAFKPRVYQDMDYPLASIKPGAVKLGTMGDAYFAAVTAALAAQNPRAILRVIRTNLDHSYSIAFAGSRQRPFDVMPPRTDEIMTYGLAAKYGFWYPLLEKSYGIYVAKSSGLAGQIATDAKRGESMVRVSQTYENLLASYAQQTVIADGQPQDIFEFLVDLFASQKIVVALSKDKIDVESVKVPLYPNAGKPYPVVAVDPATRAIHLGQIYQGDQNLCYSAEQFCNLFKLLYFARGADNKAGELPLNKTDTSNPWRKTN